MDIILLILNYGLLIFSIYFTIKNLYENFYANKYIIGILIAIICIIGILYSFAGVKVANDIVVPSFIKTKYKTIDIIKNDIIALLFIFLSMHLIKFNKEKEKIKKAKFLKENPLNWESFIEALKEHKK